MNKIIDFIRENKNVIYISCASILVVLVIFLVIVLSMSQNDNNNAQISTTTKKTTDSNTKIEETDTSNFETDDSSSEETTTEEESTEEETTTKAPSIEVVVPKEYPYLIKVNRAANCTTVYAKDENGAYTVPYKAITVSCGKVINDTPLGEFNTIISYDWRLMFDGSYGHYAYRIIGSTLFHSVPYYSASNDDLEWQEYNKLGSPASLGCVRMTVADAKWLVENCPIGTTVIIYDDVANPGPLGKPETIKIPENSPYRGWDPTDPNPNNPWHNFTASITYPSSKVVSVEEGAGKAEVLSKFSAKDTCGNDISHKLTISDIDFNTPGEYKNVTVSVVDAIGRRAEVVITVNVIAKEVETTTNQETTAEDETSDVIDETTSETTSETTGDEATEDATDDTTEDETTSEETSSNEDFFSWESHNNR